MSKYYVIKRLKDKYTTDNKYFFSGYVDGGYVDGKWEDEVWVPDIGDARFFEHSHSAKDVFKKIKMEGIYTIKKIYV